MTRVPSGIEKRTQRNIRKAEREGVSVRKAGLGELDTFIALYWETMDKRHAGRHLYDFGADYFKALLGSDRIDAEFLMAELAKTRSSPPASSCTVRISATTSARPRVLICRIVRNHLLFREMIVEAAHRGMKYLHLAAGRQPTWTTACWFSRRRSRLGTRRSSLGQSILDRDAYDEVCGDFRLRYSGADASSWFPLPNAAGSLEPHR